MTKKVANLIGFNATSTLAPHLKCLP